MIIVEGGGESWIDRIIEWFEKIIHELISELESLLGIKPSPPSPPEQPSPPSPPTPPAPPKPPKPPEHRPKCPSIVDAWIDCDANFTYLYMQLSRPIESDDECNMYVHVWFGDEDKGEYHISYCAQYKDGRTICERILRESYCGTIRARFMLKDINTGEVLDEKYAEYDCTAPCTPSGGPPPHPPRKIM